MGNENKGQIQLKVDYEKISKNDLVFNDVAYMVLKSIQSACIEYIFGDFEDKKAFEVKQLLESYVYLCENYRYFPKETTKKQTVIEADDEGLVTE